ncbi:hypothetical protein FRC08_011976 [Ceratobasidium sp. 394]|nr:hypothetical protein FRC08_011976 [Ceratobasidium sp. 394]
MLASAAPLPVLGSPTHAYPRSLPSTCPPQDGASSTRRPRIPPPGPRASRPCCSLTLAARLFTLCPQWSPAPCCLSAGLVQWNKIFQAMDEKLLAGPHAMQPRYYATESNRGQRDPENSKAADIPVWALYRCHLKKSWFDLLSPHQRDMLKASPKGWEVDEEKDVDMPDA